MVCFLIVVGNTPSIIFIKYYYFIIIIYYYISYYLFNLFSPSREYPYQSYIRYTIYISIWFVCNRPFVFCSICLAAPQRFFPAFCWASGRRQPRGRAQSEVWGRRPSGVVGERFQLFFRFFLFTFQASSSSPLFFLSLSELCRERGKETLLYYVYAAYLGWFLYSVAFASFLS